MLTKISQKNKKAAIDLSIGTVVIIVLAMSMLILGIVLIRNIFSGATESVTQIDQGVKNEINKLFADNQDRRLVLYPSSGLVRIEQGSQDSGFAISIRNTQNTADVGGTFSYEVVKITGQGNTGSCGTTHPLDSGAVNIITGKQELGIELPPNSAMENPRHVRFGVSDTAPTCTFRVKVNVYEGPSLTGDIYQSDVMDIEIIPK